MNTQLPKKRRDDRLVFRLKELCTERGITVYRLSKDLGLNVGTLGAASRKNVVPSAPVLVKICDVLKCQPGDLIQVLPKSP